MKKRRGSLIALATVAAGMVVAALAVFANRDVLIARWHIHKLRRGEAEEKIEAAARLADLRSEAAVPALEAMVEQDDEIGRAGLSALAEIGGPRGVAALISILKRAPEDLQKRTAQAIIDLEPPLRTPVSLLLAELDGEYVHVAQWSLAGLLEKAGKDAVPVLQGALESDDVELRRTTVRALWNLGLDYESVMAPVLLRALEDRDARVRAEAIRLVAAMGEVEALDTPRILGRALRERDPEVRQDAARAMALLPREQAVPALVDALLDPSDGVAYEAALSLARADRELLAEVIREAPPRARIFAARAAGALKIEEAAAALASALGSEEPLELRKAALEALDALGESASEAAPVLARLLGDGDGPLELRYDAAIVLGRVGPSADVAVPVLLDLLGDPDVGLRQRAAVALRELGPAAAPATSALLEALNDPDVGGFAAEALAAVGAAAIPRLVELIDAEDSALRLAAVTAIAGAAGSNDERRQALLKALGDPVPEVRYHALAGLESAGPLGDAEAEAIERRLEDEEAVVRFLAARILAVGGGERASRAAVVLEEIARDEGLIAPDRVEAVDALAKVGAEAVPVLMALLEDEEPAVRRGAAAALGSLGGAAREALGALRRAARGEGSAAAAAQAALETIRESLGSDGEENGEES